MKKKLKRPVNDSPTPLEPASRRPSLPAFLVVCLSVWTFGSMAAMALFNGPLWREELGSGSVYLWLGASAMLLGEASAFVLFLVASKQLSRHPRLGLAGKTLLSAGGLTIAGLLFLSLVSWSTCAYQNGFLTRSSLIATAFDFQSIFPFLSFREQATLGGAFLASAIVIAAMVRMAPAVPHRQLHLPIFLALAAILSTAGCLRIAPSSQLNPSSWERLRGIVKARLLPTATILWAPILYPDSGSRAITVPLLRRYDLAAYASRIDRRRPRPNILVFAIESWRHDEVRRAVAGRNVMPAVSRMAEEGFEFRRAYSTANESLYSMTSLISGLHPLKTPRRDHFVGIDYPLLRLPDLLSPVYDTAFISSSNERWQNMINVSKSPHLGLFYDAEVHQGKTLQPDPMDTGFAEEVRKGNLRTGTLDDATTTGQLQAWIARKREKPFFAMVSYQTSHYPYEQGFQVPAVFTPNTFTPAERSEFSFVSYPESAQERMRNRYRNSLAYIDSHIGSTLGLLKESGLLDNTIVMLVGDHGEMFREYGRVTHAGELLEGTLRVGLVLWGEGVPRGSSDDLFSLIDLPPMLLALAGMPPHAGFQGTEDSLPPRLTPRPVFATVQNLAFEDAVVFGNWKYVEQADGAYAGLFDLTHPKGEQRNARKRFPRHAECLRDTLHEFRNNQFAYYQDPQWKAAYFPPRLSRLARTWACEIAFGVTRD